MEYRIKIDGIYDERTLLLLKSKGIEDFGFSFSPKSFNFIQEHIFLTKLIPLLSEKDRLWLHFSRSNDPMILKVLEDLKKININREKIFLYCDEWPQPPPEDVNFILNYSCINELENFNRHLFAGIVFDFTFLEELHGNNLLNNFISNFYTTYNTILNKKIILYTDWNHNIFPTLLEHFDFDMISFSINSKIEICYRNVDLNKLKHEINMLEKDKISL